MVLWSVKYPPSQLWSAKYPPSQTPCVKMLSCCSCIISLVRVTATHLKLLPQSILDMYKVLDHIDICPWAYGSSLKPISTLVGSEFGVLGHLWSQNDGIMSLLRVTATSSCFPHLFQIYTIYLITLICCPWTYISSLNIYAHTTWLRIWGSGSVVESKWCHYIMVEGVICLKLRLTSIVYI